MLMSGSYLQQKPLLAAEQESQILSRVEESLVVEFRAMHAPPAPSWQVQVRTWLSWGMGTIAAAAAVLFFVVQPRQSTPLLLQGGAAVAKGHSVSGHTVPVEVKEGKTGVIAESKRWQVKMAQHTRLALVKNQQNVRTVRLQRGFVKVHVRKGAMKKFVVKSQDVQVIVTGTVFSVEREKNWVRVELFRGSVTVKQKDKETELKPGDGIRIDLKSGRSREYQFSLASPEPVARKAAQPSKSQKVKKSGPWARLRWLSKQKRFMELHRYAHDLATSRQYSGDKRRNMLSWVVEQEYANQLQGKALQTLLAMARLGGEGQETAYGSAVMTCRRVFSIDTTQCISLYRGYLKNYPKGMPMVHKEVGCFLAADLAKQGANQKNQRALQESKKLVKKYRCE